ncbi:MAG TPA: primosomal protein N', partial [Blastocatellia bacterium]|nr:primosomal protein N' [Blastocatellia bacterium]
MWRIPDNGKLIQFKSMFCQVAIPIHVRQTFTYKLPGDMADRARPGCRALVGFGKKLLTGFIVDIGDVDVAELAPGSIKDVEELIDESPVIAPDLLDLTRWMSDYYYAPWGECLRAALPAGSMVVAEQVLTITEAGREELERSAGRGLAKTKDQALRLLAQSGQMSLRELASGLPDVKRSQLSGLARKLERAGFATVTQHVGESRLRPKLQNAVRLKAVDPTDGKQQTGLERGAEKLTPRGDPGPGSEIATDPEAASASAPKAKRKKKAPQQPDRLTEQQQRVIETLKSSALNADGSLALAALLDIAGVSASTIRTLEKRGLIEVFPREVRRDPLAHLPDQSTIQQCTLNPEQQAALDKIVAQIGQNHYATFLLHGVTGSGKTEIYIRAMAEAVRNGKTALMLIPEIALTPVFSRRLREHFGDALAILHSSLSDGERVDEWRRIKDGDARVVIGTRSAVFAPLENLGVVVVDEEHETSYKQEETPRYNGRDSAIMRANNAGAVVILGSATPSLESFYNAQTGKYSYILLETRYGDRTLAEVETVDMREVFKRHGKQQTFSEELLNAIAETHARKEQIMILLNRRGFSSFLLCRSCGLAIKCPNCDVSLTYHQYNFSLQCHYCNYIRPVPKSCPACEGQYVHYVGEGTEQIEARLRGLYPAMNIARLDRDTTRRRGSFEHILMEFSAGTIDLLVGTQMIAKGHDFHNVTLVGVISADGGLSLPDFRAAERTFQLLTQVAGRAGRGERPGRVIIQSYHPEHYSIVCARAQDYEGFYGREINFRRSMHYPPFTALVNISVHDEDYNKANAASAFVAGKLREISQGSGDGALRVLGPAPAPLARLRGEYRFQVLIKTRNRKAT